MYWIGILVGLFVGLGFGVVVGSKWQERYEKSRSKKKQDGGM